MKNLSINEQSQLISAFGEVNSPSQKSKWKGLVVEKEVNGILNLKMVSLIKILWEKLNYLFPMFTSERQAKDVKIFHNNSVQKIILKDDEETDTQKPVFFNPVQKIILKDDEETGAPKPLLFAKILDELKKEFKEMTESERIAITQAYDSHFPRKMGGFRYPFHPECIETIQKLAKSLFEKYNPKDNSKVYIYSLGQSLAWLAEIYQLDSCSTKNITHVAFSGDWFFLPNEDIKDEDSALVFASAKGLKTSDIPMGISKQRALKCKSETPDQQQITKYRDYLQKLGLEPSAIIERYTKEGAKTVITDYIQTGSSLRSFLNFLINWADENNQLDELKNCLEFNLLYDQWTAQHFEDYASYIHYNIGEAIPGLSKENVFFTPIEDDSDKYRVRGILLDKDKESRLIAKYKFCDWNKVIDLPFSISNMKNIRLIGLTILARVHT